MKIPDSIKRFDFQLMIPFFGDFFFWFALRAMLLLDLRFHALTNVNDRAIGHTKNTLISGQNKCK